MAAIGMGALEWMFEKLFGGSRREAEQKHIQQIPVYDRFWRARAREGRIRYLALGDSLAQGLGLDDPEQGYVAGLERLMEKALGEPIATHNVSSSGARTNEVIERQLQHIADVDPHVVTMSIGGNDVTQEEWRPAEFASRMRVILQALPAGSIVADVPTLGFGTYERRAREANRIVHRLVREFGMTLAPVYRKTRRHVPFGIVQRMSPDWFHPNARGHRSWVAAFGPHVVARVREVARDKVEVSPAH
ncbi:SGNH/GDSL hydrolase family protein [Agrococcus casei]|uniref:SGNH/GDSL hydrolase family protein n=1 Tax=Agrococcus casei TaxID=343512 RepID=UPI003F8EE117